MGGESSLGLAVLFIFLCFHSTPALYVHAHAHVPVVRKKIISCRRLCNCIAAKRQEQRPPLVVPRQ